MIGTKHFTRSLQLDDYSCGARSVYMILRHMGIYRPYTLVKHQLGTEPEHGTCVEPMVRMFRKHGLRVGYRPQMTMKDLRYAFERSAVALIHLDGDHIGVVHGMDEAWVYIADPSFTRCPGRRISIKKFRKRWTNWGMIVYPPKSVAPAELRQVA